MYEIILEIFGLQKEYHLTNFRTPFPYSKVKKDTSENEKKPNRKAFRGF